jgi:hypothetical protein
MPVPAAVEGGALSNQTPGKPAQGSGAKEMHGAKACGSPSA